MKNRYLAFLLMFVTTAAPAQSTQWLTWFEQTNGLETPRYDQTLEFCHRLDSASAIISTLNFGKSPQGRDLIALIADKDGLDSPEQIKQKGRLILMVNACIHSGEPDGKDAGLVLLRDMAINGKYKELLQNVSILFIPVFSVDAHERFSAYNRINQNEPKEMGWRTTAANLNLNRDFLKAQAQETRTWLALYNRWLPDFFIDCHTTDGADYQYVVTYSLEADGNINPALSKWQKENYLPFVEKKMFASGNPIFPYVVFRNWHDPRSGLISQIAPPILSQGYVAMRNRPSLLIETHMLKPYKQRVLATNAMIRFTLEMMNKEALQLKSAIQTADQEVLSNDFRNKEYPLQYSTSPNDSIMVEFLGVEYSITKSDLTGGDWFQYGSKKATFKIPMFKQYQPMELIKLPKAYIIPIEWQDIIERLKIHGVQMQTLTETKIMKVKSYKFSNVKQRDQSYEGCQTVTFDQQEIEEERTYYPGSVIIPVSQPLAKIIISMLEPKAGGSLLSWGFFNTIFEQKEYAESYVMEVEARKMLAQSPELRKEFETQKASDPAFAKDPRAMYNWFYQRSPWFDNRLNVYPVGRITE